MVLKSERNTLRLAADLVKRMLVAKRNICTLMLTAIGKGKSGWENALYSTLVVDGYAFGNVAVL